MCLPIWVNLIELSKNRVIFTWVCLLSKKQLTWLNICPWAGRPAEAGSTIVPQARGSIFRISWTLYPVLCNTFFLWEVLFGCPCDLPKRTVCPCTVCLWFVMDCGQESFVWLPSALATVLRPFLSVGTSPPVKLGLVCCASDHFTLTTGDVSSRWVSPASLFSRECVHLVPWMNPVL